jgi:AcrR family transcriptional regulator
LLEKGGAAEFTMENLSAKTGVSRQTLNNLFDNKEGIITALFDQIALGAGIEEMREVMHGTDARHAVRGFVRVFTRFWRDERVLIRRIHGIAALDLAFGQAVSSRYARRRAAEVLANRFASAIALPPNEAAAALYTFTSFEFFDTFVAEGVAAEDAVEQMVRLAERILI